MEPTSEQIDSLTAVQLILTWAKPSEHAIGTLFVASGAEPNEHPQALAGEGDLRTLRVMDRRRAPFCSVGPFGFAHVAEHIQVRVRDVDVKRMDARGFSSFSTRFLPAKQHNFFLCACHLTHCPITWSSGKASGNGRRDVLDTLVTAKAALAVTLARGVARLRAVRSTELQKEIAGLFCRAGDLAVVPWGRLCRRNSAA